MPYAPSALAASVQTMPRPTPIHWIGCGQKPASTGSAGRTGRGGGGGAPRGAGGRRARAAGDAGARLDGADEPRDVLRPVLEVAVHGHDHLAARPGEAGMHRRVLAEVALEPDHA